MSVGGLIRDIGIINDLLKKRREKRLHYEQMMIEEIINGYLAKNY